MADYSNHINVMHTTHNDRQGENNSITSNIDRSEKSNHATPIQQRQEANFINIVCATKAPPNMR